MKNDGKRKKIVDGMLAQILLVIDNGDQKKRSGI